MGGIKAIRMAAAAMLLASGAAWADTHAPWPSDWNNWSDPNLWVSVGNPGNAGEPAGMSAGGNGPDRVCGAVAYAYRIGKFEVTAGQYCLFLNAVAKTDTHGLYNTNMDTAVSPYGCNIKRSGSPTNYSYSVDPNWADRPVNYVSWGDAARFANWLTHGQPTGAQDANTTENGSYCLNGATGNDALMGKTRKPPAQGGRYYIPSEDEWYKAAYYDPNKAGGAGYWDYPTGSDTMPSNDLLNPDGGNNANFWRPGHAIDAPYYRTRAGDFEKSKSPYGTFDQGGNVLEWSEATFDSSYPGLQGGAFDGDGRYLRASYRCGYGPAWEGCNVGFRVSEVAKRAVDDHSRLGRGWDAVEAKGPPQVALYPSQVRCRNR